LDAGFLLLPRRWRAIGKRKLSIKCTKYAYPKAEIRTEEDSEKLLPFLEALVGESAGFWIGLADIDEENSFMWQSTAQLLETFDNWGSNQPDGESAENCVAAMANSNFQW